MIPLKKIIFGTSCLGNLYQSLDYSTKKALVQAWFEQVEPPVIIDTAGKYGAGMALQIVGKILRELKIDPSDIIISNKLGWIRKPLSGSEPTFEPGVWKDLDHDAVQKIDGPGILDCYQQGLKLLNGYQTQLVSVHDPDEYLAGAKSEDDRLDRLEDIVQAYQVLLQLKKEGKVKAVGIGAKDWKVIRELDQLVDFDWVMLATSFTILHHPTDLLTFLKHLHHKKVTVINSAVFHSGFLTGGDFFDYQIIDPGRADHQELINWRQSFYRICHKFGITPAEACVQYALAPPGISSIALNTSKPERIKQNVAMAEVRIPSGFWMEMKQERLISLIF
ncbi:MAG: aldo/keto reductase [Candidatus Cyclobacteriaceae bacterium M3_2C_046]